MASYARGSWVSEVAIFWQTLLALHTVGLNNYTVGHWVPPGFCTILPAQRMALRRYITALAMAIWHVHI